MRPVTTIIVEDEILIAETIKLYLQERGHSVLGIAISYEEALQLLEETKPDIVLLDVRLYGQKSGIDVANHLLASEINIPYIIVSSQYDSTIIKSAMRAGAVGYITKPISKETLWSTIELAVMKLEENQANETYIELKTGHDVQRIKQDDILYFKSDHVYVEVICETAKYLCRYTLNEIMEKIESPFFVRCNRSYIVNLRKMDSYSSTKILIGDQVIPITKKHKHELSKILLEN